MKRRAPDDDEASPLGDITTCVATGLVGLGMTSSSADKRTAIENPDPSAANEPGPPEVNEPDQPAVNEPGQPEPKRLRFTDPSVSTYPISSVNGKHPSGWQALTKPARQNGRWM